MIALLALIPTPAPESGGSGDGLAIVGMIIAALAAIGALWAAMHARTQASMAQNQAGDAQRSADAANDQAASAREQVAIAKEQLKLMRQAQEESEEQRKQDRADADRRLHEERDAADRRLQQQLAEERERHHREFLVGQLQRVGDFFTEATTSQSTDRKRFAFQALHTALQCIPDHHASLIKSEMDMCLTPTSRREMARRMDKDNAGAKGIKIPMIYEELADNLAEVLGRTGRDDGGATVDSDAGPS